MREQPWTDLPDERASHGQIYLMMREPAMDRFTLGERASHGQIYLMREPASQIYLMREIHLYDERASHGQIYLMRESQPWTDLP